MIPKHTTTAGYSYVVTHAVELEEFNSLFPTGAIVAEGEGCVMMLSMAVILVGVDITTWVAAC